MTVILEFGVESLSIMAYANLEENKDNLNNEDCLTNEDDIKNEDNLRK